MSVVLRVDWFQRDPGGTTIYVLPEPEENGLWVDVLTDQDVVDWPDL